MTEIFFTDPRASRPTQVVRGLFVLVLALGLISVMAYESWRTARVGRWPEVPCTILTSRVHEQRDLRHEDKPYVFEVAYAYEFAGQRYRGEQFSPDYTGSDEAAEAYRFADAYPAGLRSTCRVNPAHLSESRLLEASGVTWVLAVVSISTVSALLVVFYAIPQVAGKEATWALGPLGPPFGRVWNRKALSYRHSNGEMLIAALFCLLLLCMSAWWAVFPMITAARAAASWTPAPCRIFSSVVAKQEIHGQHHVTLFRADVLYRYRVGEKDYTSNAHTAWDGQSPFYAAGKRAITLDHPSGATDTCYVNPVDPYDALLDTGVSPAMLVALAPGAMGLILALWMIGEARRSFRIPKACVVLAALVGSLVAGYLFVVTTFDVIHNYRAGYHETWGLLVPLLMLAATAGSGYGFAKARAAYRATSEAVTRARA